MSENLTLVDAQARAAVISNVQSALAVTVSDDRALRTFRAETTVSFDAATAGVSTFIDITADRVVSIELNGKTLPLSAFHKADNRIELSGLLQGHNDLRIVADAAYGNTGVGLHRTVDPADGEVYLYSHCEPFDAHKFIACFDQPDLKSTLDLTITGPARWTYIANESAQAKVSNADGTVTTTFATTGKISSYLFAMAAGAYEEIHDTYNGVDLALYARKALAPELRQQAAELFDVTKRGLAYYEDRFQRKYPFGKYAQLMVPDFNEGAMENPGCITVNDALCIFRGPVSASLKAYRNDVILHEMAHMWFGDLVTMKWWNDLWLNESFATVMALLAERDAMQTKRPLVDFANASKAFAMRADQMPSTHPVAAVVPDIDTVRLNFDGISYDKGAALLYQLIAWVGEDAFFAGVRQYFDDHSWANATLEDLLTSLEASSGRDLHAWSKEWLETTGVSTLRADATVANGAYSSFAVAQDSPVLRSHRIRVGLYNFTPQGTLERTRQVELDVTGAMTAVPQLVGEKAAAVVVVNDDDLTYAKTRLDQASLDTVVVSLGSITDPLTRALCWAATWDMTRDAEMPTRRFIDLVASQGVKEDEATVVDRLVLRAGTAITFYAAPEVQSDLRITMADAARTMLRTAPPGGDVQHSWLTALIGNAERPSDVALLRSLLAGTAGADAPGVTLSPEMRWDALTALVAKGLAGRPEINAELRRDNTVTGQQSALEARAAIPSVAAKKWAWQQMHRPDVSLRDLKAIVGGFQQEGQEALTRSYTDQYPALIAGWWKAREENQAEVLSNGLFPRFRIDRSSLGLADRALAPKGLPGSAQRIVREQKDGVARAIKAQARDRATPKASPPGPETGGIAA